MDFVSSFVLNQPKYPASVHHHKVERTVFLVNKDRSSVGGLAVSGLIDCTDCLVGVFGNRYPGDAPSR